MYWKRRGEDHISLTNIWRELDMYILHELLKPKSKQSK